MQPPDLSTDRLILIPMSPESIIAEKTSHQRLGQEIAATVTPAWPPENWEPHVLDWLLAHFAADPGCASWNRYVALRHQDGGRTLIGTVGGFRRPGSTGDCEVGYSILPEYQRLGYATEALTGLLPWLWQDQTIVRVCAQTLPTLPASVRVMEKCGMKYAGAGSEAETILYRLDRWVVVPPHL